MYISIEGFTFKYKYRLKCRIYIYKPSFLSFQNVQTVTSVHYVNRNVVHTVEVTDCVTRSQVNVSVDVTVVTMETGVRMVNKVSTVSLSMITLFDVCNNLTPRSYGHEMV